MATTTWTRAGLERPAQPTSLNRRERRAACARLKDIRKEYDFQQARMVDQWESMFKAGTTTDTSQPRINVVQEGVNVPKEAGTQIDASPSFEHCAKMLWGRAATRPERS